MKKLLLLFSALLLSLSSFSQEHNTQENGEGMYQETLEDPDPEIVREDLKNVNTSPKTEAELVEREEESNEGVNETPENETAVELSEDDLFMQGQKDAMTYYKGYKGAGTGTLITALVSPLAGLVPAIATSSTTPKKINLNYPNAELIKEQDYYEGYTQKAKKIKQGKVWKNWGIAFGVNLIAALVLTAQ